VGIKSLSISLYERERSIIKKRAPALLNSWFWGGVMFGVGTVTFEVQGVSIKFPCQISGDREYIDTGDGSLLFVDEIAQGFGRLVKRMKKDFRGGVILSGRWVGQCQLRPDLRDIYTGLPDDFTIDMAYGIRLKQKPARIKINGVDFSIVALSEIGARKMASILQFHRSEDGKPEIRPALGRELDMVDYYLINLTFNGEKVASDWARTANFEGFLKTKLPDMYERMKARGLAMGTNLP
jgi:hypothetical protein